MKMFIHVLVLSALAGTGVSGCQPAGKDAGNDTTESQIKAPAESVTKSVEPITEPATAAEPQAKPGPQAPIKKVDQPKKEGGQTVQSSAAAAAAARADSIKRAQAMAEAIRVARLDSLKRAEAARAARTEPITLPVATGQVAQGKTLYEADCRKCHGVRGVPPKSMAAKFPKIAAFDAAFFAKRSVDSVVTVLTNGKSEGMKSFKDKLSHDQMVAVAAYIRSFGQ
ncbi:MAG: cytochrome c [Gemmatimonadaceae bacterium]|nr:cytochrome c [Gemmatimonadaceae bacterium]